VWRKSTLTSLMILIGGLVWRTTLTITNNQTETAINEKNTSISDQLNFASSDATQQAAFQLLDIIQGIQPKGLQLSAVSFMFLMMCERYGQDLRDVLDKTHRQLYDSLSKGRGEYVRAIQQYLKAEL